MVQMLDLVNSFTFKVIIQGVYSVVIKIYDIMIGLINQDGMDMSRFEGITTTMYVLAGVFILFKVVIAMIQMLLNPDLVTDKQAGAGKLIIRIVASLIMLIAFAPNGFLFGYEGLFSRIEKAVIAPDGLINNITNLESAPQNEISSLKQEKENNLNNVLIDNVYADNPTSCYYYRISKATPNSVPGNTKYTLTINKIYKIYFYYKPTNTSGLTKVSSDNDIYYKFSTARIGGNSEYGNYSKLGYDIIVTGEASETIKNGNCPKLMTFKNGGWSAYKNDSNTQTGRIKEGLHGGTKTLNGLKKEISNLEKESYVLKIAGGNPFVQSVTTTDDTLGDNPDAISDATEELNNQYYLQDVDPTAILFGQAVASSLQDCATGSEKDCSDAQQQMFVSKEGNDKIVGLMDKEILNIGFISSMLAGIGLIVYLLFLCVEVLIRRFKLFFLEVLAPIPIISYVDPKDKTFNTWFKMYISTYLDLFIKLIAISIAIALIDAIAADFFNTGNITTGIIGGALIKFFYIVAILAFAKILPTMVSKIFNLDSMGGSFKDIMGMAKGAAGFGAGAVLGAGAGMLAMGAGIANGKGWKQKLGAGMQGLGGIASGALLGAGAGSKGKPMSGASGILNNAQKQRAARASGATWMDTKKSGLLGAVGFDDPYTLAKKKKEAMDAVVDTAGNLEDEALSKVNKAIGAGHGDKFADLVEARNDAQATRNGEFVNRYKTIRDENAGTTTFVDKLGDNTKTFMSDELDAATAEKFTSVGLTSAEAEARIKGAEKGATQAMLTIFNNGEAESLGFNKDDIAEMQSLRMDADSAARQAGYTTGYSKGNKTEAKQRRKEYAAQMRDAEAAHNAAQRK